MPLSADMGQCIRTLRREKPDMKSDQRVAICLDAQRKAGKKVPAKKKGGSKDSEHMMPKMHKEMSKY